MEFKFKVGDIVNVRTSITYADNHVENLSSYDWFNTNIWRVTSNFTIDGDLNSGLIPIALCERVDDISIKCDYFEGFLEINVLANREEILKNFFNERSE